jgi:uncharacterized membrane protein
MNAGRLIAAVLLVQTAVCLTIIFDIPIARQIIGFIYLFIPGFLILRILKLAKQRVMTNVLFSAGLSVAFLMFIGLLVNSLYPIFGVSNPLSPFPVIATVSVTTMVLCALAYHQDKSISWPTRINIGVVSSLGVFACISLLSILGTKLVVSSGNNFILLLMFIVISLFIASATFLKRFIPAETFPWLVFAIAVALLFHVSLISPYLVGYDVHLELNFLDSTLLHSKWDVSIPHNYNAMLSVTILPVIYSTFLNMDGAWVFKIVYLLIYSLVPVALFQTYQKQTTPLIAFLSAFFFMSNVEFYLDMQGLARQMIAELFLALLILLVVDRKINLQKRRLLSLIVGAALVVSHYAVAYIFMFFLISVWFLSLWMKDHRSLSETINATYVASFSVMLLTWYTFVASSEPFWSITELVGGIPAHILGAFGGGVVYLSPPYTSPMHEISKLVFYILQVFIVICIIEVILRYKKSKFDRQYILMSLISLGVLLICIFFPFFAETMKISRIYHLMLFFLAPYCILGGRTVFGLVAKIGSARVHIRMNQNLKLLPVCLILMLFFLLQTGFLHEVTGDPQPTSMPLSGYRADPLSNWGLYGQYARGEEVFSARWLSRSMGDDWRIYADLSSLYLTLTSYGKIPVQYRWEKVELLENTTASISEGSYIYLRYINVQGKMQSGDVVGFWDIRDVSHLIDACNRIYSNGGSTIYREK